MKHFFTVAMAVSLISVASCKSASFNRQKVGLSRTLQSYEERLKELNEKAEGRRYFFRSYRPSLRLSHEQVRERYGTSIDAFRGAILDDGANGVFQMKREFPGLLKIREALLESLYFEKREGKENPLTRNIEIRILPGGYCTHLRDSPFLMHNLGVDFSEIPSSEITLPAVDLSRVNQKEEVVGYPGLTIKLDNPKSHQKGLDAIMLAVFHTLDLTNAAFAPLQFELTSIQLNVAVKGQSRAGYFLHPHEEELIASLPIMGEATAWATPEQAEKILKQSSSDDRLSGTFTENQFLLDGISSLNPEDIDVNYGDKEKLLVITGSSAASTFKGSKAKLEAVQHMAPPKKDEDRLLLVVLMRPVPSGSEQKCATDDFNPWIKQWAIQPGGKTRAQMKEWLRQQRARDNADSLE